MVRPRDGQTDNPSAYCKVVIAFRLAVVVVFNGNAAAHFDDDLDTGPEGDAVSISGNFVRGILCESGRDSNVCTLDPSYTGNHF